MLEGCSNDNLMKINFLLKSLNLLERLSFVELKIGYEMSQNFKSLKRLIRRPLSQASEKRGKITLDSRLLEIEFNGKTLEAIACASQSSC
jgi:hypothetical protein